MGDRKKNSAPVSVRIAFVLFIVLGLLVTGFCLIARNDRKEQNDEIEKQISMQEEIIVSMQEKYDAEMDDDYIKDLAREEGYIMPGEQFYPIDNED